MENINHSKVLSFFLISAYFLAACGGPLPQTVTSVKRSSRHPSEDGVNPDSNDDHDGNSGSENSGSSHD